MEGNLWISDDKASLLEYVNDIQTAISRIK